MYKKLRKNKKMPVGASLVLAHLQRDYHKTLNNTSKSGITLIALILTIIILLILAMVSISYIMRENIIKHAETAANQYQIDAEKEAIELAYGEYVMDKATGKADAKLNMDGQATVDENKDEDGNNNGWTVTFPSGNVYTVDSNGKITGPKQGGSIVGGEPQPEDDGSDLTEEEQSQITIGNVENKQKYGSIVDGYSAGGINTWRLFYQDNNYTYIISDERIRLYKSLQELYTEAGYGNATGADVSNIGKRLNLQFTNFIESNTNENMKAVAYLTDPKNWKKYKNDDALYAIGGPTLELFAASFNAGEVERKIGITPNNAGYEAGHCGIPQGEYGGIYNKEGFNTWWLATPGVEISDNQEERVDQILYIEEQGGGCIFPMPVSTEMYFRPIVCFDTTYFNETYGDKLK